MAFLTEQILIEKFKKIEFFYFQISKRADSASAISLKVKK